MVNSIVDMPLVSPLFTVFILGEADDVWSFAFETLKYLRQFTPDGQTQMFSDPDSGSIN